jgi:hypothetical protein
MNTCSFVLNGRGLVWLPLFALAVSILLAGCETGVGLPSSPASQALWKDLAGRCALATNIEPITYDVYSWDSRPVPIELGIPDEDGYGPISVFTQLSTELSQLYPEVADSAGLSGGLPETGSSPSSAGDSGASLPGTGPAVWPGGP